MTRILPILLLATLAACKTDADPDLGNAVLHNSSVAYLDPSPPTGIVGEGTPGQTGHAIAAQRRYNRGQVYDLIPAKGFFPGKGATGEAPK